MQVASYIVSRTNVDVDQEDIAKAADKLVEAIIHEVSPRPSMHRWLSRQDRCLDAHKCCPLQDAGMQLFLLRLAELLSLYFETKTKPAPPHQVMWSQHVHAQGAP